MMLSAAPVARTVEEGAARGRVVRGGAVEQFVGVRGAGHGRLLRLTPRPGRKRDRNFGSGADGDPKMRRARRVKSEALGR